MGNEQFTKKYQKTIKNVHVCTLPLNGRIKYFIYVSSRIKLNQFLNRLHHKQN